VHVPDPGEDLPGVQVTDSAQLGQVLRLAWTAWVILVFATLMRRSRWWRISLVWLRQACAYLRGSYGSKQGDDPRRGRQARTQS
jgi:hypothetical protein